MTVIAELSEFVSGTTASSLPLSTRENVKIHILDTLGAMLAGPKTEDGEAMGRLLSRWPDQGALPVMGYPCRSGLLPSITATCAATRCTEIDDIHLESCTTPGSVVVPTALALARAGYFTGPANFLTAVALGYEMQVRLGMAVRGPEILYKGIWPTGLTAALGSATVAARALTLTARETSNALAMALALSTGVGIRVRRGLSGRWLALGISAQNGVAAAFFAREGFLGNDAFLENDFGKVHGLEMEPSRLTSDLGERFWSDQTGIKPYPIGRQALSALEAFREILANHHIEPESIQEVTLFVPQKFVAMIDHPEIPEDRMGSIRSIQYQIALAAFHPECLYDVTRSDLICDENMRDLVRKIRIKSSSEWDRYYPAVWPARAEVLAGGRTFAHEMLHPPGDQGNRFQWSGVISKFDWVVKPILDRPTAATVIEAIKNLDTAGSLSDLLGIM